MVAHSIWIVGTSRTGKTARLVEQFCAWIDLKTQQQRKSEQTPKTLDLLRQTDIGVLVFAANDDNRRELSDAIATSTSGKYPVRVKTILGFFQDEVILFWPLLIQSLQLKAQFPVRLRPETEQELATKLWRSRLDEFTLRRSGVNEYRLVRRILDLWQLAAYSGTPCEDIAEILQRGLQGDPMNLDPEFLGSLVLDWRNWCLERGLLTYSMITELYSQHLLTHHQYQRHLTQRYQAVLADDVDDYPAIACDLFEFLLDQGAVGAFSYNPDGSVRLGLGADPNYMGGLARHCQVETLTDSPADSLAYRLAAPMVELVTEQTTGFSLPESIQSIQTISRAQLLRQTAQVIINAIKTGHIAPEEVAIIAPGLDAIARYTLMEILSKQDIAVEPLNDQRPLISSPFIRALLTLLALIYPGLGQELDRDAVAEMLVILSKPGIDPVRAGLIADYCFVPHPDQPRLLPVKTFDRWDRIGYGATKGYEQILAWVEKQRSQQEQRLIPNPISLLYLAIQDFLCQGASPPYNQLAALRELLETAQHYWEIDTRLRQINTHESTSNSIAEFIQLLRRGTVTANPYPVRSIGGTRKAITLATIFQYRASRSFHRWHFWLDISSTLWAKGGAATLFGAPFFLRERLGEPWTPEQEKLAEEQRLRRILADLLARVSERVYLCHSDLSVSGQEQQGPLLLLVNACISILPPIAPHLH